MGRTALKNAALPSADAMFDDVELCFLLLSKGTGDMISKIAGKLLELTVSAHHGALVPRVSRRWGSNIHTRCIGSVLTLLEPYERCVRSREVLRGLVSNDLCSADSVELVCKYAADPESAHDLQTTDYLDRALATALDNSTPGSVVTLLLDHGANPHAHAHSSPGRLMLSDRRTPLIRAMYSKAPKEVVDLLLRRGADPHLRCEGTAETPFDVSERTGRHDLVHLFSNVAPKSEPFECITIDVVDASVQPPKNSQAKDLLSKTLSRESGQSSQIKPTPPNRSWFPSIAALSLSKSRRDSKPL